VKLFAVLANHSRCPLFARQARDRGRSGVMTCACCHRSVYT